MNIKRKYRLEQNEQKLTLDVIRNIGFENALDVAYAKALYLVANDPKSTLATEWLAWSQNLLEESRGVSSKDVASDLALLAMFYRKLSHKVYWYLVKCNQLADMPDFIRRVK